MLFATNHPAGEALADWEAESDKRDQTELF
jgi:hypothetical protein